MAHREHAQDDRGKVTAGLPSLSSEKRRDITEDLLMRVYQASLQAEYRNNEQAALAPDGAIGDTTNIEQVVGIPLTGYRVMARLRKLNKNLYFEQASADKSKTGVYILKPNLKGGMDKEFLIGMETEWNPEFSLRVVDNEGKAKGIISGWRRVLTRLIRARIVNEAAAFRLFGPPSRDSENWARFVN